MFHVKHYEDKELKNLDNELHLYLDKLLKWQKKINLVSPNTIQNAKERHITDSLQLINFIPENISYIIDMGSGAGLPGIPLAIITKLPVFLVESDIRKCVFLNEVVRELNLSNCQVVNERIENCSIKPQKGKALITARALAELNHLFDLATLFCGNNKISDYFLLLLKGENVSRETFKAKENWRFDISEFNSITSNESSILEIRNLTKK